MLSLDDGVNCIIHKRAEKVIAGGNGPIEPEMPDERNRRQNNDQSGNLGSGKRTRTTPGRIYGCSDLWSSWSFLFLFPVILELAGLLATHSSVRAVSVKRDAGRRMVGYDGSRT